MSKKIFLPIIAIMLFFASAAFAESMTGNYKISYYQDNPVERTMIFSNTESSAKNFSLDILGEKTAWTYVTPTKETIKGFCASTQDIVLCVAPTEFSLAAGANREIYFFSKAKTYARPGTYYVDAFSNNNKIGTFEITILQGHLLELTIDNANQTAGQCEPKTFSAIIKNTGFFDDEATISIEGIPKEWVSTTEQYFLLASSQSKNIEIKIQAPCDQELKGYTATINAQIPKAGFSTSKTVSFSIENKQGLSIADLGTTGNTIAACKEKSLRQPIQLTNNGRLNDELELSIKAPDFVKLETKNVSITAGATKTINLSIEKTSADEKVYEIELTVKSKKFGLTATKKIQLSLSDCYNAQIKKVSSKEQACIGTNDEIKFEIQNNRTESIAASLSIDGAKAKIDKPSITIAAGKTETVTITANYSNEQESKKEIKLNLQSDYFTASATTSVELFKCRLEITTEKPVVDVNVTVGTLTRIKVLNKTLSTEKITVLVQNKNWILFNPKEFSLNSNEEKDVYMYVSPPYYSEDEKTSVGITARSSNYSATKSIDLNIFGGTQIGKADLIIGNVTVRNIGNTRELYTAIRLENDSNVSVTITDINSKSFETKYTMADKKIKARESATAELTIKLPVGFDQNKFSVPLTIKTDQGDFERALAIDLAPQPNPTGDDTNKSTEPTIGIGFAFLGEPKNIAIIAIIIALIAIIAYVAMKGNKQENNKEKESKSNDSMLDKIRVTVTAEKKPKKKK